MVVVDNFGRDKARYIYIIETIKHGRKKKLQQINEILVCVVEWMSRGIVNPQFHCNMSMCMANVATLVVA